MPAQQQSFGKEAALSNGRRQKPPPQASKGARFWMEIALGILLIAWGGLVVGLEFFLIGLSKTPWNWVSLAFLFHGITSLFGGIAACFHGRTIAAWMIRITALFVGVFGLWYFLLPSLPTTSIGIVSTSVLILFIIAHWLGRGNHDE